MRIVDRFVNWTNDSLVPEEATEQERNNRFLEVGICIGMVLGVVILAIIESVT